MMENKLKKALTKNLLGKDNGETLVSLFDFYNYTAPSTSKLIEDAADLLEFDKASPEYIAMTRIAKDLDNDKLVNKNISYHNLQHFKEVFISSVFLAKLNNDDSNAPIKLSKDDLCVLCLAAISHDLEHDGRGNEGILFNLEKKSFKVAKQYMQDAGVSEKNQKIIKTMILTTDINGPKQYAEAVYTLNFNKITKKVNSNKEIKETLKLLKTDLKTSYMSMILDDADLLPSMGLTFEKTNRQTNKLFEEVKKMRRNFSAKSIDQDLVNFFMTFCNGAFKSGFSSHAGKKRNVFHEKIVNKFELKKKTNNRFCVQ